MSLFKKDDLSVYHIHVPRTGGRFITQTLVQNNFSVSHVSDNWQDFICGVHPMHLHYPLYEYLEGVEESKQFAVVRDPVSRFVSQLTNLIILRSYDDQFVESLDDMETLTNFIQIEALTAHYHNNWFRRQVEYMNPKVSVWKFEDGLCNPFRNWFYKKYNVELEDKEYYYYAQESCENNPIKKEFSISKKLENNIKNIYIDDYRAFDY